jgi:hypothetical protein
MPNGKVVLRNKELVFTDEDGATVTYTLNREQVDGFERLAESHRRELLHQLSLVMEAQRTFVLGLLETPSMAGFAVPAFLEGFNAFTAMMGRPNAAGLVVANFLEHSSDIDLAMIPTPKTLL